MSQQVANQNKRGHSTHQNEAHRILRDSGYTFTREGSHNSNIYFNEHGQKVVTLCSPRNNSQALNNVRNKIRAHAREIAQQEAHMNAETTTASVPDQLVAMADSFLTTPLRPEDHQKSPAYRAKYAAYAQWLRRTLERHAPLYSSDLEEATRRLGYGPSWYARARKELGIAPMRELGTKSTEAKWILYLPHQVPEDRKPRVDTRPLMGNPPPGVQAVREDEPEPAEHALTRVTEAATNGNGNGRHLTEQQTAALMLLESLGIQSPGEEAKLALDAAAKTVDAAQAALEGAQRAIEQARAALA